MPGTKPTFETPVRTPSAVIHICARCGAMVEQPAFEGSSSPLQGRALHQIMDRRSRFDSARVCLNCYVELTGEEP
jgi:hypothetical protein